MAKDIKRHISTIVVCKKRGINFDYKEMIFFLCSLLVTYLIFQPQQSANTSTGLYRYDYFTYVHKT
jgi:hypothetical protein